MRYAAGAIVLAAVAVWPGVAVAAKDDLIYVTPEHHTYYGDVGGAVSDDGRYVAYSTWSLWNDIKSEVFVRDVLAGTTVLASRADGPGGAPADDDACCPQLSADGRYVAFVSRATNLSVEDDDRYQDVFVRDLVSGQTLLVSRATGALGAAADYDSDGIAISGDGRTVAFESGATNLSAEDSDMHSDVFVRDLEAQTTTLASRADGPLGPAADSSSANPSLPRDGRRVAFTSWAPNLSEVDNDGDVQSDIFLRDLDAGTTSLVSRATGLNGASADEAAFGAAISGDGRKVAFSSSASNLSDEDVDTGTEDERYSDAERVDVFIRDVDAGITTLVSRASGPAGAPGNGGSGAASVSHDGRFVGFHSQATNLSDADDDLANDVFLRDLLTGSTTLVSRAAGAAGPGGNDDSNRPWVSGTGRFVGFQSTATNFADEPLEDHFDVFLRDVLGPPIPVEDTAPAEAASGAPGQAGGGGEPGRTDGEGRIDLPPVISRFRARPDVLRLHRWPRRAGLSFVLSERAGVRVTIRRHSSRCRPRGPVGRRCGRWVEAGTLGRSNLLAGPRRIPLGWARRGRAAPGLYVATITAVDSTGNESLPRRTRFKVVGPR